MPPIRTVMVSFKLIVYYFYSSEHLFNSRVLKAITFRLATLGCYNIIVVSMHTHLQNCYEIIFYPADIEALTICLLMSPQIVQ